MIAGRAFDLVLSAVVIRIIVSIIVVCERMLICVMLNPR